MNTQPTRYSRSIQSIVVICFLTIAVAGRSETGGLPTCSFVAEQGLAKKVSVLINKTLERPELLCVRVVNGQKTSTINYGYGDISLERLWFGIVWSSSLRLKDFFWRGQQRFGPLILFGLKPRETSDHIVGDSSGTPLSGQYRVRLCYHVVPEEHKQQCVYSEAVSLP